jgi:regulator of sigma E protease
MESIFYAGLAILGLGFLVFIHELGHYWIARRVGMRVEAFSIGFGRPLYTWERDGVKWMICLLPFGGYVKIAGMQREGSREPYEIADGFYQKKPWQRIKVALAGPLVNIFFALFVFVILWLSGGRTNSFTEFTNHIGWVDPASKLYSLGVRPGDVIERYNNHSFHGFKDLLVASLMEDKAVRIEGYKVDAATGEKTPFDYTLSTYENPEITKEKLSTIGVFSPASYLIYGGDGANASGIEPQDRILWADGELIFSLHQLSALTNQSTAFLTVQRGDQIFHTKAPRVRLEDLKMTSSEKAEVGDWQYEAALKGKLPDLFFIPYNLSPDCVVEGRLDFLDPAEKNTAFLPLEEGDRILAVDGIPTTQSYQLLESLQTRRVLMIVERDPKAIETVLWNRADAQFEMFDRSDLNVMIASIGTSQLVDKKGDLALLNPVVPKSKLEFTESLRQEAEIKKQIESIRDPVKREAALKQLEIAEKRLVLGLSLRDRNVIYNPTPIVQFKAVLVDTWRTLAGLFSGTLNPKYMSGPVGIVHVVHQSWMVGVKEALFWMAIISLNLGVVNLLPIPVLDGGHIMFSLFEAVTKRALSSKTMERLVIPFVGLLIAFFFYVTYQDIARLLSKFF